MSAAAPPVLVGRDAELRSVRGFLRSAGGGGAALLLTGDPGAGASALLAAAAALAEADGMQVAAGGPDPAVPPPFPGLARVLAPLLTGVEGLSGPRARALATALGTTAGRPPDRLLLCTAVLSLLRSAAGARPLAVLVDDGQQLDPGSAEVLALVARRLPGSRVGLLVSLRTGAGGPLAGAGLPTLGLDPLDDDAAALLLRQRSPGLAPAVARRVLTEAAGNPLALAELPAALTDEQRTGASPLPATLPLGARLGAVFAAPVEDQAPPVRELLLLAALDDTRDPDLLLAAGPHGGVLDDAEAAGLLRVSGTPRRVVFPHPLVVPAVVGAATPAERRQAHRALAGVRGADPQRRAWHLAEATGHPDEQVATELAAVAREGLRRGDAVGAVAALARAAALTPDPERRRRREAEAAYLGADVTGALGTASPVDPAVRPTLEVAVASAYATVTGAGDVAGAHRLLAAAVDGHPGPGGPALAEALHTLLLVCFFGGRSELWAPFTAAVRRLGTAAPTPLLLCEGTMADPVRTAGPALGPLDAAVGRLDRVADPTEIVRTAMAACYLDRLPGCRAALQRVVDDGRDGGAVASAIDALLLLAVDDLATGRWDEAAEAAGEGVDLGTAHGYQLLTWPGHLVRALVAAGRGDDATVRTLTDGMTAWAAPRGARTVEVYAWHARALAALGRGDPDEAYRLASRISPAGTLAPHVAHALWVVLDLVEAAARSGRRAEARRHADAVRDADVAALSPRLALVAAGAAAMAADGRAAPLYEAALAVPGSARWPFELARIELAFGEHLRTRRGGAEATAHLLAALDLFRRLRARPWVVRAAAGLRAAGVTVPDAPRPDPAGLAPVELAVVRLAATGLTNRQIGERLHMSPRTVGSHLYRVFPKLGVTSRTALPGALDGDVRGG